MKPSDYTPNAAINNRTVVPVILSGGSGSRLWPVSRGSFPKQFWPLLSDKTLLQETALRGEQPGFGRPVIVCNADHRFIIAEQLREVGITDARIVLEPMGRNSAPAIAAAALLIAEENPEAVMWVMAADAAIKDQSALNAALAVAVDAARQDYIVTFGMKPTKPETGYGYIERGSELAEVPGAYRAAKFMEKPDREQAAELIRDEHYLWNSGMFVARASTLLKEIEAFEPLVYSSVRNAVSERTTDSDFVRLSVEHFAQSPDISIDYAVAERTKKAAVVPGDFGWSDIGSWDALWELTPKDADGNATSGDVFLDGAKNCYVRSDGIVATVTGVEDLIVVVTKDAVMVSHRDRAQDVKKMVARLTAAGRPEALSHNRVYRPWGFYESLIQGDRFQVKRISVDPGQKLSLQKHFHRAEHWVVVAGTAMVTRDADLIMVRENESVYLPLGAVHRLENPGRIPLTLIEVQSGPYLGEDDIVRIEDVYARA
ncbi:mannose-1-phosphate guanylyltransferase/mannose-6-phosphate isomerase [Gluconacetobacter sp. 1b LMG 1731]|uniref:mannose-1-phosphate guanylyltransferase n=1 Tax=Gluconacetobacter dulcium TaxID=2729096 RepID=A0A7W4IIN1_9PROT|nr:mannose-1-phosphate guanylyltransferase/mannose-6-phosphate isomerase [Gluconacetobacter dulcium]MBB2163566.1 mannose-1-phosphate guanylyltransferase/mannose-6-phosphate isomerase [Gluconacetobacter dulcium]MBB2193020.1 mannose-1-phosphate guanylyltransferase/mannose-6-phosphate isomerase [Gluconacetobacter dulcium]